MLLLVKPYLGCNINCDYCYQRSFRKLKKPKISYDLKAIFKRMEEFKNSPGIALHGGEILALPKKDVEALLAKSHELQDKSDIQTNGTLIDDEYIAMFKKYNTSVGVSWDGPDELSEFRPGTKKVGAIIDKLVEEGVYTSVMMVISKANAGTKERLEKLKGYLLHLKRIGVQAQLNPCLGAPKFGLPTKKLVEVYLDLANFCLEQNLQYSPFREVSRSLKGNNRSCFFSGCDLFSTSAVNIVLGDGSLVGCMFNNKPDVLLRHPAVCPTRGEILSKTPQEFGGCKDCAYWPACKGGCPSGAIDNDWRNRTYLCPLWKALFAYYEKIFKYMGETPVL